MQPVDEGALVVRLEELDIESELPGSAADAGVDLVERFVPVDLRFARADEIEVRPLEHEDGGHVRLPAARSDVAASRTSSSGTSLLISTPVAVGRTQRMVPPTCFLSVARCPRIVSSGKGSGSRQS